MFAFLGKAKETFSRSFLVAQLGVSLTLAAEEAREYFETWLYHAYIIDPESLECIFTHFMFSSSEQHPHTYLQIFKPLHQD